MYNLSVNTTELKRFTDKLQELHRSNLPIVVRQTLNDAAFDVLKNTLPASFRSDFTIRNKSFLKSHSGVQKADGWEVNGMKSRVGITPNGSIAAAGLTKQEEGGTIKRPFMYMDKARISNSNAKSVRAANYINKMGTIKGAPSVTRRSRKSNFIASAIMGQLLGKLVLWESKNGNTAFLIKGVTLSGNGKKRKANVNAIPLANYQKGYHKNINARHFLREASEVSASKMQYFYIVNAKKRIEKALQ